MKVKEDGYVYEVQTANGVPVFDIVFCRNVNKEFQDGITNEELINVLVSRLTYLVKQRPTTENMNALTHMAQVKHWINARSYKKLIKRKNTFPDESRRNDIHLPVKSG